MNLAEVQQLVFGAGGAFATFILGWALLLTEKLHTNATLTAYKQALARETQRADDNAAMLIEALQAGNSALNVAEKLIKPRSRTPTP